MYLSNDHYRCGICNCVSSEEIATNAEDFQGRTIFVPDSKSPLHFVCLDCADATEEVQSDWAFMEELDMEDYDELFDNE